METKQIGISSNKKMKQILVKKKKKKIERSRRIYKRVKLIY